MTQQEGTHSDKPSAEAVDISNMDGDLLRKAFEEEKAKSDKYLVNWQRAEADLSNLRKRFDQERNDTITFSNSALLKKLLPVLDDFDHAFEALSPKLATNVWAKGIDLIYQKLKEIVKSEGVTSVETTGKPFDPNLHDAYCQQNGKEGIIVAEIEKGYMYKGKVLRAAKVTVGNGIEEPTLKCDTNTDATT